LALVVKGIATGYIGASVVYLYQLRILAWMAFLFDDDGDDGSGWQNSLMPGMGHWFNNASNSGGGGE
jgi:hypothetical protein